MNDESATLIEKLINEIRMVTATVKILNEKVEGWRTHTGSTGYFLQVATEDLTKSVDALLTKVADIK